MFLCVNTLQFSDTLLLNPVCVHYMCINACVQARKLDYNCVCEYVHSTYACGICYANAF